ncbi:PspC domain-containing protein [Paenibacillus senegalensis]|uniref:PspC domain-containing protein n=1 Tax=Paenibacillus senegalensis TaxID=1465766 RepID=UPI000288FDD1|nr:PspC domain-containing protein [Paenibacillus senegalensis]
MKKLYRSRRDSKLFGICGGLAEMFNVDATLLRLIVVVTAVLSSGTLILVYFIAAMIIPLEPKFQEPYDYYEDREPYRSRPYERYERYTNPRSEHRRNRERPQEPDKDELDEMMKDIEKKAMQKEIEELKAKLAKYEKGDV